MAIPHAVICLFMLFGYFMTEPEKATQSERQVPKLVLAFYYPWYGTPEGTGGGKAGRKFVHWEGVDAAAKAIASSTHYPVGGAYDSQDPALLARHCELAAQAGLDGFIASWWGKNSFEDQAIQPLLDACAKKGLKLSIYYEQIAKPGTPRSVAAEVADLVVRFGSHPAFLKVREGDGERPVLFVYGRAIDQLGLKEWKEAVWELRTMHGPQPLLIADHFGAESFAIFDGAHAYGPMGDLAESLKRGESAQAWAHRAMSSWTAMPRAAGKISCVTVFPGYDDTKIRTPGLKVEREKGALYETLWREAVAARPDWVLITSFNEWHEGSEIEPSEEQGSSYVEQTATWVAQLKHPR